MSPSAISVVLPVYDGARHLAQSIRSVLAQQERGFELLLCDDASRDGSLAIVEQLAAQDSRVRVLRHAQNRGLFPTLNELVRESRGELIRLWAQDDVMYPQCLATELAFMRAHPEIAMSYCASDAIDERSLVIGPAAYDGTPDVLTPAQASELMFYYGSLTGNIATVMLRRSTLDAVGPFREDLRVSGDFELWVRIAERLRIGFVRVPLIGLRRHAGQFSRRADSAAAFMRENRELRETLLGRLPPEMHAHGRRYLRRRIHPQHAHHALRCLLSGDARGAAAAFSALRTLDAPLPVFWWWLATANGRWLAPAPQLRTF